MISHTQQQINFNIRQQRFLITEIQILILDPLASCQIHGDSTEDSTQSPEKSYFFMLTKQSYYIIGQGGNSYINKFSHPWMSKQQGTKPDTLKLIMKADAYTNLNQITTLAHREACSFPSNTTRFRSLSTFLNTCQIMRQLYTEELYQLIQLLIQECSYNIFD